MTERVTLRRAVAAIAGRLPRASLDIRLRNRRLLERCRRLAPDAVILIGDNTVILPETLAAIRASGVILVYTCGTSPIVFSHAIERAAARLYDVVIANDLHHAAQWQELGARRVEVLPMSAVDPEFHRPYDLAADERDAYACDVGFVGTVVPSRLYGERIAALEALRDVDLGIWSVHDVPDSLRPFHRGALLGEEMARALCAARILVNPHGDFMRYGGNQRLFEACGAGAFQITDDRPGVRAWFTPGEHLMTYRDPRHLRELVRAYLGDDPERRRIGESGRRHVLEHHTYARRMTRLVELITESRDARRRDAGK
jgi:spore maturation protein CgeB